MNNNDKANLIKAMEAKMATEQTEVKPHAEANNKEQQNEAAEVLSDTTMPDITEPGKTDSTKITISLPNTLSQEEATRLQALVDSKRSLLTKALETDELAILTQDDKLSFPWFTDHGIEGEAEAYAQLVTAMVKMAKEQKRIVAKDKQEENEKFAMRIFTVRLGLKGDECKLIRKLLAHNLSGNSAWKNGKPENGPKAANKPAIAPLDEEPDKTPEKPNKAAKKPKTSEVAAKEKEAGAVGANASDHKEASTNE